MIEDEPPYLAPPPDEDFYFDPTPEEFFRDQAVQAQSDLPVGAMAVREVDDVDRLKRARVEEAEQANKMRRRFFWFGVLAASACVAASAFFMWSSQNYGQRVSDVSSVAFISGLSVQAIGITKIMANYLFPSPGKTEEKS